MAKNHANADAPRTQRDLPMPVILGIVVVIALAIWLLPIFPVSPLGAIIVVVFGFFFATVSSRMVGLIGSSNNPVSGMAIATLIIATLLLKATGTTGTSGMIGAICIGSIILVCIPSSRQLKKYKIFVLPGWISGNIFMPPIVAFHEIPLVLRLQVLSVAGRLYSNLYIL